MPQKQAKKFVPDSPNPISERLQRLKSLFPEAFTEGKFDCDKLKTVLYGEAAQGPERYGLAWAGKTDCFTEIQQSTTATLKPDREESVDFDSTQNLFIEGDNLQVLKILQKSYYGKVKMIYIDPPYNTGNDSFIYPDRFAQSKTDYQLASGEITEEGTLAQDNLIRRNAKDSGHYHSNWLNMMYPRLFLARNLLRQDGVIFVSIDENEFHNLKMVMNEIFGEECFIAEFVWKRRASTALTDFKVSTDHEYVLAYHRSSFFSFRGVSKDFCAYDNPDNDPKGPWVLGDLTVGMTKDQRPNQYYNLKDPKTGKIYKPNPNRVWAYIPESMDKLIEENKVYFPEDTQKRPMLKRYKDDLQDTYNPISSLIPSGSASDSEEYFTGLNSESTRIIQDLFKSKIMDYTKPLSLIKSLTRQVTSNNDIILDFFAGSCTTAHAVMGLNAEDGGNRKFICVQLPEPCEPDSEAAKAGFKTIADIGKERIRRAAKQIKKESQGTLDFDKGKLDFGFKVFKLSESNFKIWQSNIKTVEALKKQMGLFVDNVKHTSTRENILYELILKSGLDLNVTVESSKADGKQFYALDGGKLIICLEDKLTQKLVDAIIKAKPEKVICLDTAFGNNDQLKTNTILQMESEKIDFKVI